MTGPKGGLELPHTRVDAPVPAASEVGLGLGLVQESIPQEGSGVFVGVNPTRWRHKTAARTPQMQVLLRGMVAECSVSIVKSRM